MIKIAIVGSRTFNDYDLLKETFLEFLRNRNIKINDIHIISGGAKGADSLAEKFAIEFKLQKTIYIADWYDLSKTPCVVKEKGGTKYNSLAGFNRNNLIVKNSDIIFAFHDGQSKGTKDTIAKAEKKGKNLAVYDFIKKKFVLF